jgi:hypothetical protein
MEKNFFRKMPWYTIPSVTLGASLLLAVICDYRNGNSTVSDYKPMSFEFAKLCISDKCDEDIVLAKGQIVASTFDDFIKFIEDQSLDNKKATICFDSPGGLNESAFNVGKEISKRGYNTCVSKNYLSSSGEKISNAECNSVCPFVFLSGENRRLIGSDFFLGVHSSGDHIKLCGCKISTDDLSGDQAIKESFIKLLADYKILNLKWKPISNERVLINKIFEIPHDSLRNISINTVREHKLATSFE